MLFNQAIARSLLQAESVRLEDQLDRLWNLVEVAQSSGKNAELEVYEEIFAVQLRYYEAIQDKIIEIGYRVTDRE